MLVVLYNYTSEFDGEERDRLVTMVPTMEEAIEVASKFFKRMNYDVENELHPVPNSADTYEVLKKYSNTDWEVDSRTYFIITPLEKIQEKINSTVDKMYY